MAVFFMRITLLGQCVKFKGDDKIYIYQICDIFLNLDTIILFSIN